MEDKIYRIDFTDEQLDLLYMALGMAMGVCIKNESAALQPALFALARHCKAAKQKVPAKQDK